MHEIKLLQEKRMTTKKEFSIKYCRKTNSLTKLKENTSKKRRFKNTHTYIYIYIYIYTYIYILSNGGRWIEKALSLAKECK